jgi:hypothetical protein
MQLPVCLSILAMAVAGAGCSAPRTATVAGKVVAGTVSVASKTAVAAASTGEKVAVKAVASAGTMSQSAISAVGGLAKGNLVTFFDKTTGMVRQVPWVDGLQLYTASRTAKLDMAGQAIQIVRGSQIIETSWDQLKTGIKRLDLKPGDLVEMTRLTAK